MNYTIKKNFKLKTQVRNWKKKNKKLKKQQH